MDVLVVGGTRFVGRYIVEAALDRGLNVTLFNRGNHPEVFPDPPLIRGDRDQADDLAQLADRPWDAVIDTCAYRPEQVRSLLAVLSGRPHYTLVSTISVYDDPPEAGPNEDDPVHEPLFEGEVTGETYGPLKVGCERVAEESELPLLIARPGLVAGPYDPTDRFTYWVRRVAEGGQILAPEGPDVDVQWIDVRDLGLWVAAMCEGGATGTYNVVNPAGRDTLGGLLATCRDGDGDGVELVWADGDFLLEHDVAPFRDLPLWLPEDHRSLARSSSERAVAQGLSCRPTAQTVRDTRAWLRTERGDAEWKAGLKFERERDLIDRWQVRQRK